VSVLLLAPNLNTCKKDGPMTGGPRCSLQILGYYTLHHGIRILIISGEVYPGRAAGAPD